MDYADLPAVRLLFERARAHVPPAALPRMVMNDPGHGGYVAAYERVLAGGLAALHEPWEGGPLIASFDIAECLICSHSQAASSAVDRWFSILTASIELLGAALYRDVPLSASVGTLLRDSFALEAASVLGAPVDLLPRLCRELAQAAPDDYDRVVALLGELLAAPLTEVEIEARCRELQARHDEFQQRYADYGERNWLVIFRPDFIWGAIAWPDQLGPWLELVEARFPSAPAIAAQTRDRLLSEGCAALAASSA